MKKICKKVISLLLCVLILVSFTAPAFAESEKTAFIVVSGMNTFPLYDEDNNKVYPLTTNTIVKLAAKLLPYISEYLVTRDSDKLADKIIPIAYDAFEPIACNKDGESAYTLHTDLFDEGLQGKTSYFEGKTKDEEGIVNTAIEKYGIDNTFFFNYDWRLDPLEHADRLNEFIKNVKEKTGCTRVALAAFSMGGTVTCAYLYKYGSKNVDVIELASTAFQGTSIVGDLFRGLLEVDMEGLFNRLAMLTRDNTLEELVDYINEGLTLNGFNDNLSYFANNLISEIGERVYRELLIPIFGYMPGLWALCDYDSYDEAKEFMLKGNVDESLIKSIDEYHYNVQGKAKEILTEAQKDTNIYIFAQYNMQGTPVSANCTKSNNDYLIDCIYASGGATCSNLGETLGEDYKQQLYTDCNYLSPDGQIDASTCMFPDKTWFIRDMGHVDYPVGDGSDFIFYFADQTEQVTVKNAKYSQFLSYSYSTEKLTETTNTEKTGFFHNLLLFFGKIRKFFYNLFNIAR